MRIRLIKSRLFLFISIWIFFFFLFFLIELNDVLDECMLDDGPCYPDIEQSLNRYFNEIQNRYPMLLTYHPMIDCNHGRYLLINENISSHMYHMEQDHN